MLSLDIRTLSFIAMISSLLLAVGLQLVNRVVVKDPSLRLWAMGASANGGGFILFAMRGIVPDLLSIVVGNTLLIVGSAWLYLGTRRFSGLEDEPPWYWFMAAATAPALYYFTYTVPSLPARIVALSAATAAILLANAFILLHPGDSRDRMVRWFLAAGFLSTALFLCARAVITPFAASPGQDFMAVASPIHTLSIVFAIGLNLVLGIGLPLLVLGKMQRQFMESEARFRAIIEASPVPLALNGDQQDISYLNLAFIRTFGYTLEDIPTLAEWWLKAYPDPQYRQWVATNWQVHLEEAQRENRQFDPLEVNICCKDGVMRTVLVGAARIGASLEGLHLVTLFDITERKQAEEAFREQQLKYRLLFETANDGIFIQDETGFIDCNRRGAELYGCSPEEVIGHHPSEFAPERQPDGRLSTEVAAEKVRAAAQGTPQTFEWRPIRTDGTPCDVEITLNQFRVAESPCLLAIVRDITERKQAEVERARLEAQLRESQKLEALGLMAGGVAHDFNNALAAILGNLELAKQDVRRDHPALVSLEEIGKASRRAKDLVQQILAFGRQQKLERKPTSLALVVAETARLIRATLPAMVSLKVNCEADTPAVLADATQVKQILLNLCGNAAHSVQDIARPGVIEVSLSDHNRAQGESQGSLLPGRYACLTVRDNGSGMDEATRSRIFEPFFTTKAVGMGTGLGLAVVHGIARAHEAGIEVECTPGEGSTFRIYFPAIDAPVEEAALPKADAAPIDGAGKRVLYVDDEEAIVFLMKRLLERQGFRVSGYTDPREALSAVRADPGQFDLAVTDYNMPGMSGLQMAEALREIRADLPVVLASGYITEELRQKAPAAGVRELIYKPNTADDLCEAVARYANAQSKIAS